MAEELFRRMERALRRFGGKLPVDDLLPELDPESGGFLSSSPEAGTKPAAAAPAAEPGRRGPSAGAREQALRREVEEFMNRDTKGSEHPDLAEFMGQGFDPNTE